MHFYTKYSLNFEIKFFSKVLMASKSRLFDSKSYMTAKKASFS